MINLLSVNIEGDKHLDKILKLIDKINPDVICMQEVFEEDAKKFVEQIGGELFLSPIVLRSKSDDINGDIAQYFGTAIISKLPVRASAEKYYVGHKDNLPIHVSGKPLCWRDHARSILSVVVKKDNQEFNIATTHFIKSEHGVADDFQKRNLPKLLDALADLKGFIICGDFNAPRGMEMFDTIAKKYKDNIDPKYTTSLDPDIHRAGPLPYMIDGLFTTPEYKVTHMHFETGVSDHYAIVSEIEKVQ